MPPRRDAFPSIHLYPCLASLAIRYPTVRCLHPITQSPLWQPPAVPSHPHSLTRSSGFSIASGVSVSHALTPLTLIEATACKPLRPLHVPDVPSSMLVLQSCGSIPSPPTKAAHRSPLSLHCLSHDILHRTQPGPMSSATPNKADAEPGDTPYFFPSAINDVDWASPPPSKTDVSVACSICNPN